MHMLPIFRMFYLFLNIMTHFPPHTSSTVISLTQISFTKIFIFKKSYLRLHKILEYVLLFVQPSCEVALLLCLIQRPISFTEKSAHLFVVLYNEEHIKPKACTYPRRSSSDSRYHLGQPLNFGVKWNVTYFNTVALEIHKNLHRLMYRNVTLIAC
jgi:hypothetical protein